MRNSKVVISVIFLLASFWYADMRGQDVVSKWKQPIELSYQIGLPDPFLKHDGSRIKCRNEWSVQRNFLKEMVEYYQYGVMPPIPDNFEVKESLSEELYDGRAIRKLYVITLNRNGRRLVFHFGLIKPPGNGPFPAIIKNDRDVPDPLNHDNAELQFGSLGIPNEVLTEVLERGYIYCAFNREDIATDIHGVLEENRENGVFPLYPEYSWGTIAAWAWGYKLIIEYFQELDFVDNQKIIATGHSRGGKAALCGGIYDERIAITAPNSSGLGGTSSHYYDELLLPGMHTMPPQSISMHLTSNPHWWSKEYYKLAGYESKAPFDAHFGKIIIAPRAFFNTHSYQDYHANPMGAWLTTAAAQKVYKWLGAENNIAMHFRTGGHSQNIIDWFALLDFCDLYFYNKQPSSMYNTRYDFSKVNPYPQAIIPVKWDVPN